MDALSSYSSLWTSSLTAAYRSPSDASQTTHSSKKSTPPSFILTSFLIQNHLQKAQLSSSFLVIIALKFIVSRRIDSF
jgi:hypothetical protein